MKVLIALETISKSEPTCSSRFLGFSKKPLGSLNLPDGGTKPIILEEDPPKSTATRPQMPQAASSPAAQNPAERTFAPGGGLAPNVGALWMWSWMAWMALVFAVLVAGAVIVYSNDDIRSRLSELAGWSTAIPTPVPTSVPTPLPTHTPTNPNTCVWTKGMTILHVALPPDTAIGSTSDADQHAHAYGSPSAVRYWCRPRSVTARMCAPVVPPTVASGRLVFAL